MSRSSAATLLKRLAGLAANQPAFRIAAAADISKANSFQAMPKAALILKNPAQNFVVEAVRGVFNESKFEPTEDQLLKVSQAVQQLASDVKWGVEFELQNIDPKPLTQEELAQIVGESVATINWGAKEEEKEVLVFGFGNMARAILSGFRAKEVQAVVNNESKLRDKQEGVAISYVSKANKNYRQLFEKVHQDVILSVKPQTLGDIADDLAELEIAEDAMVISVMAGVSTKVLRQIFPNTKILRTMPNTPLAEGYGVTGIFLPDDMKDKKSAALEYFGFGNNQVVFVSNEEQINAVTGVSGSGPAYFFMIAEECAKANPELPEKAIFDIMRNAFNGVDIASYKPKNRWSGGIKDMVKIACTSNEQVQDFILSFTKALYEKSLALGFLPEDAKILAVGTAIGAGQYGFKSKDSAETLRKNVTSPNGTTHEALKVFQSQGDNLNDLVGTAVQAATDRSGALGKKTEEEFLEIKAAAVTKFSPTATAALAANTSIQERA